MAASGDSAPCEMKKETTEEEIKQTTDQGSGASAPDADVKMETVAEAKTEEKSETKTDVKTEAKTEEKTDEKSEAKTEEKSETKSEDKSETKTEAKSVPSTDVKTETKTDVKSETKSDVKVETNCELSDLEKRIVKQIEYYFGDVNLGRDRFLQDQIKRENGWVEMETLLKFNRLRTMSDDAAVIVAALRKASSGMMEVNEDGSKVRRSVEKPLPVFDKERRDHLKARSVYVKGFSTDMSLDALEEFFLTYGEVEQITMKKDVERKFKGSLYVLFKDEKVARKLVSLESLKHNDTELIKMFKDEYFKKKTEKEKKLKQEQKQETEEKAVKDEPKEDPIEDRITKASVIQLRGLPDGASVESIREKFTAYGEVAWVEFSRGDTEARVRFSKKDEGKSALEKAKEAGEGKYKYDETEIEAYLLEGDEEVKFWKDLFNQNKNRKQASRGKRRRFGGGPQHKRRKY